MVRLEERSVDVRMRICEGGMGCDDEGEDVVEEGPKALFILYRDPSLFGYRTQGKGKCQFLSSYKF